MKSIFLLLSLFILTISCRNEENVIIYEAPEGEVLNETYKVTADGKEVPVYNAKIGAEEREDRHRGMDDHPSSHKYYDIAGFAYFDLKQGPVKITVTNGEEVKEAKILPSSFGIIPKIDGKNVSFEISQPQHLTIEINGEHIRSLHLLVNPEETEKPDPNDPNVIYFGPGIHNIAESIEVEDNQTLYIAGGAIVRCFNENTTDEIDSIERNEKPSFILKGKNIKVLGRGIIDHENVHRMKPRNIFFVTGEDIFMNGIILRNSSLWTVSLRGTDRVTIDNIKLMGHRANSDGIDICDSWDVLVENCFIRTLDDLIVVKTFERENGSGNILAQKCVLWNEVAHALSIGAELKYDVSNVTFRDCDIIGDHCREWSLRVYQCDKGTVKNVLFENIRIEEAVCFISLWINEDVWSTDSERGHIQDIVFKDIVVSDSKPLKKKIEFLGFDERHAIKNITLDNVIIQGEKVSLEDIIMNDFVYNITVK